MAHCGSQADAEEEASARVLVPGGQGVHALLPGDGLKEPRGQAMHGAPRPGLHSCSVCGATSNPQKPGLQMHWPCGAHSEFS